MSALELPVHITIIVEHGEGKLMVHHLTPGGSVTDDGVQHSYDQHVIENRGGARQVFTTHRITWTEVEPE